MRPCEKKTKRILPRSNWSHLRRLKREFQTQWLESRGYMLALEDDYYLRRNHPGLQYIHFTLVKEKLLPASSQLGWLRNLLEMLWLLGSVSSLE